MSNLRDIANAVAKSNEEETSQEQTSNEVTQETEDNQDSSLNTEKPVESSNEQTEESQETNAGEETSTTEESTESTESSKEETQGTTEQTEQEALTPEEFIEYVNSETEGDEELRQAILQKFGVEEQPKFANEQVAQLNKFIADTGRTPEDYFFLQSLDTENMDAKSAVMQSLALDNPELNAEELQVLFDNKYKFDEDEHSEKEIKASEVQLKVDGKKSLNRLKEFKSEWQKPIPQQKAETQQYLPDDFADAFAKDVNDVASFEFNLNDKGEKFEFKLDDKYGTTVEKFNTQDPLYRFRDSNGQLDTYRIAEERALIDNFDSIIKSVYQQGLSTAQEKMVTDKKNLNINQQNRPPAEKQEDSVEKQQRDKVMKSFLS